MSTPRISVIISVYNMAPYLPEFLASLDAQTYPLSQLEILFIDDGSTDDSARMITEWSTRGAPHAQILSKPNAGLAEARNDGLARVSGEWVTFPDPDDVLEPAYFSEIITFLDSPAESDVHLLCANLLLLNDTTRQVENRHPLRFKFARGTQVVDLDRHPTYIHLQSASAFFRREIIERLGLQFDPQIVPNFEDAHFTTRYLDEFDHPRLACISEAHYHYRRRADGSSLVQSSWSDPDKYTIVTRYGYLSLAQLAHARRGYVPIWLQNLLIYDLSFYFLQDERVHSATAAIPAAKLVEFHRIVTEILTFVDTETVDAFSVVPTSLQLRRAMVIGYQARRQRPTELPVVRIDADQQIAQVRYYYGTELPVEEYRVRGRPVQPAYEKIREIRYLGRTLMFERIVWLPADGTLRICLDGHSMPLVLGKQPDLPHTIRPAMMWDQLTTRSAPPPLRPTHKSSEQVGGTARDHRQSRGLRGRGLRGRGLRGRGLRGKTQRVVLGTVDSIVDPLTAAARRNRADGRVRRQARTPAVRQKYGRAWVFIDRDDLAQDNAEHLYRYVRDHHPEVNSWFVLRSDSPDWERLNRDAFRLVEHGSREHTLLMLNADHLVSSQIDDYVVRPLDQKRYGPKSWRFTFLQHGVTKDDLSRWINGKPISLLITATEQEYRSIAGDHTPYIFTSKEVRLTGFPRHDRLLTLSRSVPAGSARLLLVAPTWRRELLGGPTAGGNARSLRAGFRETTYAREWVGLMSDNRLREISEANDLQVVFVPHPNMQAHLHVLDLPDYVQVRRYADMDIQELLAHGAVMITDYSSMAFEMAYLKRPVIYFQFDQSVFFGGGHVYRKGSWSYQDDGFGPVTTTRATALAAIEEAAAALIPAASYLGRMESAFPFRDGGCCERVFTQIANLVRPIAYEAAYRAPGQSPGGLGGPPPGLNETHLPATTPGPEHILVRAPDPTEDPVLMSRSITNPALVIVSGAGRSGTSAMAGSLKLLGYHIPTPEVNANESNPRGHFEPRWVVNFHRMLLTQAHAVALDARPEAFELLTGVAAMPSHREQLAEWLSGQLGFGPLVIKDPRILWFRGLWTDVASDLGLDTAFITILRHPAEVVGSRSTYYAAGRTPEFRAADELANLAGWINASQVNEQTTRTSQRSYVRYNDLLADWRGVMGRVSADLGLRYLTEGGSDAAVNDFINGSLRRVRVTWEDLDPPPWLRQHAEETWSVLNGSRGSLAEKSVQSELDELRSHYTTVYRQAVAVSRDHLRAAVAAARSSTQPW